MFDFLAQHSDQVWLVVILAAVAWLAARVFGHSSKAAAGDFPMRVYCNHCNWEGTVTRAKMACGRCRSKNVSVLAV